MAKILLVDDSETVRVRLKTDLENANHQVLEAEDGVQGINKLESNPDIQLIITDVNMPEMDGITMCTKICEMGSFSNLCLFVLTTEFDPELKAKGKQAGVKLWVTKPVKSAKLIKAIDKVLAV